VPLHFKPLPFLRKRTLWRSKSPLCAFAAQVVVRLRQQEGAPQGAGHGDTFARVGADQRSLVLHSKEGLGQQLHFEFDYVTGPDHSQEELFKSGSSVGGEGRLAHAGM